MSNIKSLIDRMPATDREKEGRAGDGASKFTGPDPAETDTIFAEILSGGREALAGLAGLIREPGDAEFQNYKAGYLLHGLVIFVGGEGRGEARQMLADVLASELGNAKHSTAVKGFFIRELRLIGGAEAVGAIAAHLSDDNLCSDAAQALLTIRDGVAPHLRSALEQSKGRTRLTILHALGSIEDAESAAVFEKALADDDPDARLVAARALAGLGQPAAIDALIKFADSAEGTARAVATDACLRLAEKLSAAGKASDAARIYTHFRDTRTDPSERHVREAAERALAATR
jgi:HEAT repeat protein